MKRWRKLGMLVVAVAALWWALSPAPLPPERGDWAAEGQDPASAVHRFLGRTEGELKISGTDDRAKAHLFIDFRGDDSVDSVEYWLTLVKLENGAWRVESARYDLDCLRSFSFRGSPCI